MVQQISIYDSTIQEMEGLVRSSRQREITFGVRGLLSDTDTRVMRVSGVSAMCASTAGQNSATQDAGELQRVREDARRKGVELIGDGHSHLPHHPSALSSQDRATLLARTSNDPRKIHFLAKLTPSGKVEIRAYDNQCHSLQIVIRGKNNAVRKVLNENSPVFSSGNELALAA